VATTILIISIILSLVENKPWKTNQSIKDWYPFGPLAPSSGALLGSLGPFFY